MRLAQNDLPGVGSLAIAQSLLLAVLAYNLISFELIPADNGLGYDGATYAKLAAEYDEMIRDGLLSKYYAQRILLPVAVRVALDALSIPVTRDAIIYSFIVINFVALCMSATIWWATIRAAGLNRLMFFVGYAGICLIYPNAKQAFYYPVLTDTVAFLLGCTLVYALVIKSVGLLLALGLVGSFIWQISASVVALLSISMLFTFRRPVATVEFPFGFKPVHLYLAIAFGAFLALMVLLASLAGILPLGMWLRGEDLKASIYTRLLTNIPALAIVTAATAGLALAALASEPRFSSTPKAAFLHVAVAGLVLIIPRTIVDLIANPALPSPGMDGMAGMIAGAVVQRVSDGMVLLPLVAHAVYFGPVFMLLVLFWHRVVCVAVQSGPAFVVGLLIFTGLAIFSESRFNTLLWPLVVFLTIQSVKSELSHRASIAIMAVLVFVYSRIWITINQGPWPEPKMAMLDQWPKSIYFAPLGPWMNWTFYLAQSGLVVITLLILIAVLRPPRLGPSRRTDAPVSVGRA